MSLESQPIGNTQAQESVARNRELFKIALGIYRDFGSRKLGVGFEHIFGTVREVGQNATVLTYVGVIAERQIQENLTQQRLSQPHGLLPAVLSGIHDPNNTLPQPPDRTSLDITDQIRKPNTPPRWERQVIKILKRHPLAHTRKVVAQKLTEDWNANIREFHEQCTVKDAKKALKRVEKQATKSGEKLTLFLYELIGSGELRSIIIERERKKHAESLTGVYYSGFRLPELPDTKPLSNSNSEMAVPVGVEVILFNNQSL